ncbi:MAG: AAA family ATPase [Phyllobacteriaceae bacterium]|nr:AAA family ATPase [Phyllobacteriaceae bacterium]
MNNLAYDRIAEETVAEELAAIQSMRPVPRISIQAFCETEAVSKPIERAADDRRMAKAHVKVHMGGIASAVEYYHASPTPNLIILESRLEPRELMAALAPLAEVCDPSSRVVIVGHYNDVSLYRELIKNGIAEYIVAPIAMADIIGIVSNLFVNPEAPPLGRTLAFVGAKGGSGSSTIAHNTAWAITSLFSTDVVVADMDLAFGTANIDFDQDPAQGIAEAVFSPERIDEVYLDRLLAQCSEKLSLLAAPSSLDRTYDFDPQAFSAIIDIAQRSSPIVVLDVPHAWTGWTKTTLMQADEVVITATPDLASLRNTKNLVDMLKKLRPNDFAPKLIINQSGVPKRPEIAAADFAEPLGLTPLAVIPFDVQLFGNAANNGRMLGEIDKKHPISGMISEIAHVLTGRAELKGKKKGGLDILLSRLKRSKPTK